MRSRFKALFPHVSAHLAELDSTDLMMLPLALIFLLAPCSAIAHALMVYFGVIYDQPGD